MHLSLSPMSRINYMSKTTKSDVKPKVEPKLDEEESFSKCQSGKKGDFHVGFVTGAFIASILTAGVYSAQNSKMDCVMNDLKMEYTDPSRQKLVIEDLNNDHCPEIIIENPGDERVIYDMSDKKVFIENNGERTEWGY